MHKIVLLRHGESVWNRENRFTGWADVGLTPQGLEEARQAGLLLDEARLSARIRHPHVVPVVDVVDGDGGSTCSPATPETSLSS